MARKNQHRETFCTQHYKIHCCPIATKVRAVSKLLLWNKFCVWENKCNSSRQPTIHKWACTDAIGSRPQSKRPTEEWVWGRCESVLFTSQCSGRLHCVQRQHLKVEKQFGLVKRAQQTTRQRPLQRHTLDQWEWPSERWDDDRPKHSAALLECRDPLHSRFARCTICVPNNSKEFFRHRGQQGTFFTLLARMMTEIWLWRCNETRRGRNKINSMEWRTLSREYS